MRCEDCGRQAATTYGGRCFTCTRTPYRYPHHGTDASVARCDQRSDNAYGDSVRCVLLVGHGASHEWTCPAYAPKEAAPWWAATCALPYGHPGTHHITHGGEVSWEYGMHWRYDDHGVVLPIVDLDAPPAEKAPRP